MACNSCGGSSPIRIERTGTGGSRSSSAISIAKVKAPLRPKKISTAIVRTIKPANHLDKRM